MTGATIRAIGTDAPEFAAMIASLQSAELPTGDLAEIPAEYFMLGDGIAFGGLALFGRIALLRSLVVVPGRRGNGFGAALLSQLLAHARTTGAHDVWLLTSSAQGFFARHGFAAVDRSAAPAAIAATRQFESLCPASAVLMHLRLA